MKTRHTLIIGDARREFPEAHLIVTSPPYPMVEMWDATFRAQGAETFEDMHALLDTVWAACARALVPGGFVCVNVGDATRTIAGRFALWPNHVRIASALMQLGLTPLPDILWRKPTNAPNKFMGSGMLPAGAYVTYEHEYILVYRKGDKRVLDAVRRRESAYFWEERNEWFSDLWSGIPGASQGARRSAAFPFEIPYRLIQMYSLIGDVVLDPFVGTGTTMAAALASGRSSVGCELEADTGVGDTLARATGERASSRLRAHREFAANRAMKHTSAVYGFPVTTAQEVELRLWAPVDLQRVGDGEWVAECAPVGRQ